MFARSEYDRGVNTFSPEGRLFQVEYATEAIKLGSTTLGIVTPEGVLLAAEKRVLSSLMEPAFVEKIMEIERHVACAMSGLSSDSRTLLQHARHEATNHTFVYNEMIPVESVTRSICDLALSFGEGVPQGEGSGKSGSHSMSRPFGVAMLIAGCDHRGPQLYHADPSGTYLQYSAKAIGAGSENAQTQLKEEYRKDMSLKDAEALIVKIMTAVMEEKMSAENIELLAITPSAGIHFYSTSELTALLAA